MKIGNVVTTPAAVGFASVLAVWAAACSSSDSSTPGSPSPRSSSPSANASANPSIGDAGGAADAAVSQRGDTDGGADKPCDATFCDDFERDALGANGWTVSGPSAEWASEVSLDTNAFNGTHAARFHTVGVPSDDTEDEHTALDRPIPTGNTVDVSFQFFAAQAITTANDFAEVWAVYFPTGIGQPYRVVVMQQVTGNAATLGFSAAGVAGHSNMAINAGAWHLVRVLVDVANTNATLFVDGAASDTVSFRDNVVGFDFNAHPWSLQLGPQNTSGAPSVDFRYDAFRLTVR